MRVQIIPLAGGHQMNGNEYTYFRLTAIEVRLFELPIRLRKFCD